MPFSLTSEYLLTIKKYRQGFEALNDFDSIVEKAKEFSSNPFALFALGSLLREVAPKHEKWVFMHSDAYRLCGMPYMSLKTLVISFRNGIGGKFMPRRIIESLLASHRYSEAFNFYFNNEQRLLPFPQVKLRMVKHLIDSFNFDLCTYGVDELLRDKSLGDLYLAKKTVFDGFADCLTDRDCFIDNVRRLVDTHKYDTAAQLIMCGDREGFVDVESISRIIAGKGRFIRSGYILDIKRRFLFDGLCSDVLSLSVMEQCCFLGINDEAWEVSNKVGKKLSFNAFDINASSRLYYMNTRLSRVFEERKSPLIDEVESDFSGLVSEYNFDLNSLPRQCSSLNNDCKVNVLISGQIRSFDALSDLTSLPVENASFNLSTWDSSAKVRPRLDSLFKIFPKAVFNEIPNGYTTKPIFRNFFPSAVKKYEVDAENSSALIESGKLSSIKGLDCFSLENESDFETSCSGNLKNLKAHGKLNQAKMFYKLWMSWVEFGEKSDSSVFIRLRPDLKLDLDAGVIADCVEMCRKDSNLLFVPYINEYGYGDQLAIGGRKAMEVYCSAWLYIRDKGFRYDERMEDVSKNGAEEFLGNHLLLNGVKVRLLPILNRALVVDALASEVIDARQEIERDYSLLSDEDKQLFTKFFDAFLRMQ